MAVADNKETMSGISSNPSMLLHAPSYIAEGAEIVYGSNYFNGKAVRVDEHGQKIFSTEWLGAGVLSNNIIPILYFSDGNGTAALQGGFDGVKIIVYKREVGSSMWTTKELNFLFNGYLSSNSGATAFNKELMTIGSQHYYFDKNCEYKFEAFVAQLTPGAVMHVETFKLQFMQQMAAVGSYQTMMTSKYADGEYRELIPISVTWSWTAVSDSSGRLQGILPIGVWTSTGSVEAYGRSITYGTGFTGMNSNIPGIPGIIHAGDGCHTTAVGGVSQSASTYYTSDLVYLSEKDNIATVEFRGYGYTANTQQYFTSTIFGYHRPEEM